MEDQPEDEPEAQHENGPAVQAEEELVENMEDQPENGPEDEPEAQPENGPPVQAEAELVQHEFQLVVNTLISMLDMEGADLLAARDLVRAIYDGMAEDEGEHWDRAGVERIKRKIRRRPTRPRIEYLIRYFTQFLD